MFLLTVNDSSFIKEKIKIDKKRVRLPTLTEVGRDGETFVAIIKFISI